MISPAPSVDPYSTPDTGATSSNSLARASFVIAIVLAVLAIVLQLVSRFVPILMIQGDMSSVGISIVFAVFSIIELILGIFGFALGCAAARRGGAMLQAGIGIGVGGFVAINALVSLVSAPLAGLLY